MQTELQKIKRVIGVGGIGAGICFALEGAHDLRRNESRSAKLTESRDYCKLHIIMHYLGVLLKEAGSSVEIFPVGRVGKDATGQRLVQEMETAGLNLSYVEQTDAPTLFSVCYQYPDKSGGNITSTNSAAAQLTASDVAATRALFAEATYKSAALVVPEAPLATRRQLLALASEHSSFRAGSFTAAEMLKEETAELIPQLDLIALNAEEAEAVSGASFDMSTHISFLDRCAAVLTNAQPRIWIVVTGGENGAFGFDGKAWRHVPAVQTHVESTAGAGDALFAGVVTALLLGLPFIAEDGGTSVVDSALYFGSLLAAFSVTSPHTIHPHATWGSLYDFAKSAGVIFEPALFGDAARTGVAGRQM